ncbi:MAG: hypothetical protein V1816_23195 [Pseudomonadota bacterium]
MIVKMRKVVFLGLASEKEAFIRRLQEVGLTHIILPPEPTEPMELIRDIQKVVETRKFLARQVSGEKWAEPAEGYQELCSRLENLKKRENELQSELLVMKKELTASEAWGEFNPPEIEALRSSGLNVGFFRASRRVFSGLELKGAFMHITRETEGEIAFVVFSFDPIDIGLYPEKDPSVPSRLRAAIEAKKRELEAIGQEYRDLAKKIGVLELAEDKLRDDLAYGRVLMNSDSALDDRLFVLSCWSPVVEKELIQKIGPGFTFTHLASDPEPGDRTPVLMSNPSLWDAGEDLVKVYSHPNYTDFDPSGLVFIWFAVFFGMIIGDAGYGLILMALTAYLKYKQKGGGSPLGRRMVRLSFLLSLSVIIFGILGGSYMGLPLGPENPLRKALLLDVSTPAGQSRVMLVSVMMGMVHITISLAIKVLRSRDWPSLGWIIVIWSGYVLIDSQMIKHVENPMALYIMIGGLALVLLFTSSSRNPIFRLAAGLNGVLGIIQLFSDVLSYLRLFALGLATAYMTQTFNLLAGMAIKSIPYVGVVLAVVILVGGHTINLTLGVMGGVIHGLRLNFLEWYRWCFEGDGLSFVPFAKKANKNS